MAIRTLIGGNFECEDCGDILCIADMVISDDGKDSLCCQCYASRSVVAVATVEQEEDR